MPATLARIAAALSAVATLLGLWFWDHERTYAAQNPRTSELAETLQWVGLGLTAIGVAGVLLAAAVLQLSRT